MGNMPSHNRTRRYSVGKRCILFLEVGSVSYPMFHECSVVVTCIIQIYGMLFENRTEIDFPAEFT